MTPFAELSVMKPPSVGDANTEVIVISFVEAEPLIENNELEKFSTRRTDGHHLNTNCN